MQKKILFIVFLAGFFCLPGCFAGLSAAPRAEKGILDLRGWDPDRDGPVELKGEWAFYWKRFLTDEDVKKSPPAADAWADLPSFWNGFEVKGREVGSYGYGTYYLRILIDRTDSLLAVKNLTVYTAYECDVNGRRICSDGRIAKERSEGTPHFMPKTGVFGGKTEEVRLLLRVSNFHNRFGGAGRVVVLGGVHDLSLMREKGIAIDMVVFGCLLFVGIYYFVLYMHRRREVYTLYFALFCCILSLRSLLTGEMFLVQMIPSFSYWLVTIILDLSLYLGLSAFLLYLAFLYPRNVNRRLVHFFLVIMAIGAVLISFTPSRVNGFINPWFQVAAIFMFAYFIIIVARAIMDRRQGARLFMAGFILLLLAVINDFLFYNDLIPGAYISPYGLVAFILIQTVILSGKFSFAFHSVERLTKRLAGVNRELSTIVDERTEELNAAMEELQATNENLMSVNRDLESAHRTAARDMAMAANVQQSYLPVNPAGLENYEVASYFKPAAAVSGDFYDYYVSDTILRGAGLFDVSGHGIASGLITMLAKATFFRTFMGGLDKPLDRVITFANDILQGELENVDNYLTGVLMRFKGNTVEYVNAAHGDILLRTAGGVRPVVREDGESISGVFLGVPIFTLPYEVLSFDVESNDVIFLFSDCLEENRNDDDEVFGRDRVIDSLASAPGDSADTILHHVINDFFAFIGGEGKMTDDLTVLVLRKK